MLTDAEDATTSANKSTVYNAAYMSRVYGQLGVNYDIDAGKPFIYCEKFDPKACATNDPHCPVLEKCYAEPENRAQRLGCMTVFKYVIEKNASVEKRKIEVTLKGCWQHDKEVIADCKVQDEANVLSMKQSLRIISGMLEGLAFLHEAQGNKFTVVHRDIKSKNILLKAVESVNDGEVALTACIADFGLAAVFSSPQIDDQVMGQVGTFRYMSPEVLEGATEFTVPAFQRIDVYAMALVMWEVLSRTALSDHDEVPPYKQPFEDVTSMYPSLGEMRDVVVASAIEYTIRDMWHTIADGRITASLARERMNAMNGCDSQGSEGYHSSSDHNRKVSVASTIGEEGGCAVEYDRGNCVDYKFVADEVGVYQLPPGDQRSRER
ncbi:hypothetical protein Q1695_015154 [Nippostrongylus brasiliensis]|nr:hypothetical protein Q1695_015154 [Nippostrongylus brasiliensis]